MAIIKKTGHEVRFTKPVKTTFDGDDDMTDVLKIKELVIGEDGEFFLNLAEGAEAMADDLSDEDLADIAEALEAECNARTKEEPDGSKVELPWSYGKHFD